VRLPGDKSIAHRYAMLAAIAEGKSELKNFPAGADCASTLACVRALGVEVTKEDSRVEILGRGPKLARPNTTLDCGNSGSTMRMLAGILAGQEFECELRGDESLSRRPMERIIAPLRRMGAEIESAEGGRPPLRLRGAGSRLRAIDHTTPVASAQVKSCVLFAGLFADGTTSLTEPARTRDHTEIALRGFGAEVKSEGGQIRVAGGQRLHALQAEIPGDISSAAFFLCAAALLPGSQLLIDNLLLNPTRAALLDVLAELGARISIIEVNDQHGELAGRVQIEAGELRGISISGMLAATLIDELPVLAAIAPFTERGAEIRDAAELRVKESDRIAAIAHNLRAMGAQVEELADGWRIPGRQRLRGGEVKSGGDHRIAMSFAVAALRAEGETSIQGADAAKISYPEFFDVLGRLAQA